MVASVTVMTYIFVLPGHNPGKYSYFTKGNVDISKHLVTQRDRKRNLSTSDHISIITSTKMGLQSCGLFCLFVLFCFVLFCFVLFCFVLFCFVLFCFLFFSFLFFSFLFFSFLFFSFLFFSLLLKTYRVGELTVSVNLPCL